MTILMPADVDDTLIVPRPAGVSEVLRIAAEALSRGVAVVVVTVVGRQGSTPATPGQKLVRTDDGRCAGTVGGGALERAVLGAMSNALATARAGESNPMAQHFALGGELGMCCGGGVDVLIEAMAPARAVGIVGAGHIATALAPILVSAGFSVTVVDERESWTDPSRVSDARVQLLSGMYTLLGVHVPRNGALLVMSHDHQLDQDALAWALREGYAFVGGVGSRAKVARFRARLHARDVAPTDLARVRMPLGLAIGARSPGEIAVAIAAELVAWRHGVPPPSFASREAPGRGDSSEPPGG